MPSYTNEDIVEAIKATKGMIVLAAKRLGCATQTIHKRIEAFPELAEVVKNEREATKDFVEIKLIEAIQNGEPWALKFYAERQMRDRGYGDKSEIELSGNITIPFMGRRDDLAPPIK